MSPSFPFSAPPPYAPPIHPPNPSTLPPRSVSLELHLIAVLQDFTHRNVPRGRQFIDASARVNMDFYLDGKQNHKGKKGIHKYINKLRTTKRKQQNKQITTIVTKNNNSHNKINI